MSSWSSELLSNPRKVAVPGFLIALLVVGGWRFASEFQSTSIEPHASGQKQHKALLAGGMPKDWRVSLAEAERRAAFRILLPNHSLANNDNITDAYLFPQGAEVSLRYPEPPAGSTTQAMRPPFIEILEERWTRGAPLKEYKQDIERTPAIGKSICYIDQQTPALCVEARSPSDSLGNNAAYLRFVTGGLQVQLAGGDQLWRLMDIAKTLTRA